MPQTRRAQQKLIQQHSRNSLGNEVKVLNKNKDLMQDEKLLLCQGNDSNDKNVNSTNKKVTNNPQGKLSGIRVKYNLSQKKQQNNNNNTTLTRAWRILSQLKAHKSSWPFRYPVDPISQGVPDYLQKISHPMDLKTIQRKLKSQKYLSQKQFFDDVQLMLRNSYEYNPKSSVYYKLTVQLQDVFNQLRAKGDGGDRTSSLLMGTKKGNRSGSHNGINNDVDQQQQENGESYNKSGQQQQQQQQDMDLEQQQNKINKINDNNKNNNNNKISNNNYQTKNKFSSSTISKRQRQLYEMEKYKLLEKKLRPMGKKVVVLGDGEGRRVQLIEGKQYGVVNNNNNGDNINNNKDNNTISNNIINNNNQNNNNNINKRIGYSQCYQWQQQNNQLPLINRQHLLYDILHLEQQQSQQQLYQYIMNNQLLKKHLLVSEIVVVVRQEEQQQKKSKQSKLKQQQPKFIQQQQEQQQQKQFELSRLDIYGYRLLRKKVDMLMKQQQEQQQKHEQQQDKNQEQQQQKQQQQQQIYN